MKIHYLSDVHLEFNKWRTQWDLGQIDCDVHVLAGDIGVGLQGLKFALALQRPVIYVCGNHEFYGQRTVSHFWKKARAMVADTHVHLLENESVVIGDTRFLGCTLWTDFCLLGTDQQESMMNYARSRMNDYVQILIERRPTLIKDPFDPAYSRKGTRITPAMVLNKHLESRGFLERELAISDSPSNWKQTVVVTHHAPSARSLPYPDPCNADSAYASHLDHLVAHADLWIHGHVHEARDYALESGGRVAINCRGYKDHGWEAVENFTWDKVILL